MIFRKKGDYYVADGSNNEIVRKFREVLYEEVKDEDGALEQQFKAQIKTLLRQQHRVTPLRIRATELDHRGMVRVKVIEKRG